jgi:hypothetical protein
LNFLTKIVGNFLENVGESLIVRYNALKTILGFENTILKNGKTSWPHFISILISRQIYIIKAHIAIMVRFHASKLTMSS